MRQVAIGRAKAWVRLMMTGLVVGLAVAGTARAQLGPKPSDYGKTEDDDEDKGPGGRFKVLTGPDALEKLDKLEKSAKEKLRPPIEFLRTQVAPFDILPFVKARHWSTISLELRVNYGDYEGRLETEPVPLQGMPHEVTYQRDARLLKGQQSRLSLQTMLPEVPKEIGLSLVKPDALRADDGLPASLRPLEPHQMLIVVLASNPNDYGSWTRLHALLPTEGDHDAASVEKRRYYRLVLPQDPKKPPLSPHPLTWTTTSHVIWDGIDPDILNPSQQQAMLDWLHWGGQIMIAGGASASYPLLLDSFLGPYLPADPAGENLLLKEDDLAPLAEAYRPPIWPEDQDPLTDSQGNRVAPSRYSGPVPPHPAPNRPVYFAGLRPREGVGATPIPLGDRGDRILGVERRVGRGRILMLSFSPTDPAFASWPGLDTMVRRVFLRRPEEPALFGRESRRRAAIQGFTQGDGAAWAFPPLGAPDLTWVRFVSRDLGAQAPPSPRRPTQAFSIDPEMPRTPVAEWSDAATLPLQCRKALKEASGITIPGSPFILRVLLAYVIALVPVNWLVCRFVLKRREWAWALVPLLSLGFAIGVERAAAYDLGFDSGCDEIDVLELQGSYPRGHLSRFAALFSTGRVRYTISHPADGTALALPMDTGDSMRGEKIAHSVWQSSPVPALVGLQVQPRSLALYRSEQMMPMPGSIELVTDQGRPRLVNGSGLELRDAVLVEDGGARTTELGMIAAGATVELDRPPAERADEKAGDASWTDLEPLLAPLRSYNWRHDEDKGEIRLVAWSSRPMPGQKLEPAVDRHRGLVLVVAHLMMGPPPAPVGPHYDALATTLDKPSGLAGAGREAVAK